MFQVFNFVKTLLQQKPSDLPAEFNIYYEEIPVKQPKQPFVDETIATYETVSKWLKENKLNR